MIVEDEPDELVAVDLASWLAQAVDPSIGSVTITKLAGGHSSGAWHVAVDGAGVGPFVLKAPAGVSVVHRRDAGREGRIVDALQRAGAPVPRVVAIDDEGRAVGRPCFLMELVEGRSPADSSPGGYHDDPQLQAASPADQRAAWDSFHDALTALHTADTSVVGPIAAHEPPGQAGVLAYWREALLDIAPAAGVPRQLAVLDWLLEHLPAGADDDPALCMGDARFVNCLLAGTEARALVDFEVAYLGNPAADIAYSLFFDAIHRTGTSTPLPGLAEPDEVWARWESATGRVAADRGYWTVFGATILVVTATRAMVQWGLAGPDLEASNPLVAIWEQAAAEAGR